MLLALRRTFQLLFAMIKYALRAWTLRESRHRIHFNEKKNQNIYY